MLNSPLRAHAAARPDQAALVLGERSLSYAELVAAIDRAAAGLAALGIGPASRIVTCLGNSIEHVVLLYAIARVGATVATLDVVATAHEVALALADFEPELVFGEDASIDKIEAARGERAFRVVSPGTSPLLGDVLAGDAGGGAHDWPIHAGRYLVQYTSGSTGKPKGVVQSQRGLQQRLVDWNQTARLAPAHSHLCILPLSHGYGCYCVSMPALASGGTLHLYDLERVSPLRIAQYLVAHGIRCFYALPYFYQLLARLPAKVDVDFAGMHLRMVGSAPITEATACAFAERYGARLHNTYGLSEVGIITSNLDHDPGVPLSAIGKLIAGYERLLVEPEDPDVPDVSELVVRSAGIAEGYFSPEHGPITRTGGWLYTGDLVRTDARGNFVVVGRKTQFINVSGNKVMPEEIEAVLQGLPGVLESAVIGVADPATGERVAAFIVTAEPVSEETVRTHCARRLSSFKVPHYVRFVANLPKSAVGKVQKARLRLDASCGLT